MEEGVQIESPPLRRPINDTGKVERGIVALGMLAALGWLPYMISYWMSHGWPEYAETYFVGLVVFPAVIFGAGRLLATSVTLVRRWWQTRR
jgi:hypothetical protein